MAQMEHSFSCYQMVPRITGTGWPRLSWEKFFPPIVCVYRSAGSRGAQLSSKPLRFANKEVGCSWARGTNYWGPAWLLRC